MRRVNTDTRPYRESKRTPKLDSGPKEGQHKEEGAERVKAAHHSAIHMSNLIRPIRPMRKDSQHETNDREYGQKPAPNFPERCCGSGYTERQKRSRGHTIGQIIRGWASPYQGRGVWKHLWR